MFYFFVALIFKKMYNKSNNDILNVKTFTQTDWSDKYEENINNICIFYNNDGAIFNVRGICCSNRL